MKTLTIGILALFLTTPLTAKQDPEKQAIAGKLGTKVNCAYDNLPLIDVINDLKNQTGIANIVPANEVKEQFLSSEGEGVTLHLKGVSARTALKMILGNRKLTAIYRDGALTIASAESVKQKVSTIVYDVRDLNYPITDFPGPRVDLRPLDTHEEKFGKLKSITLIGESPALPVAIDEVLRQNAGGGVDQWEKNGWSIEERNGTIAVTTTKKVHEEVVRILAMLRQFK